MTRTPVSSKYFVGLAAVLALGAAALPGDANAERLCGIRPIRGAAAEAIHARASTPTAIEAEHDVDGDGISDYVFANVTGGQTTFTAVLSSTGETRQVGPITGDLPMPAYLDNDGLLDFAVGTLSGNKATVNGISSETGQPFTVELGSAQGFLYGCSLLSPFKDSLAVISGNLVVARELNGSVERRIGLGAAKAAGLVGRAKVPFTSTTVDKLIYQRKVTKPKVQGEIGYIPCANVLTGIRNVKPNSKFSFAFNAIDFGIPLLSSTAKGLTTDSLSELVSIPSVSGVSGPVSSGDFKDSSGEYATALVFQRGSTVSRLFVANPNAVAEDVMTAPGTLVPHRGIYSGKKRK